MATGSLTITAIGGTCSSASSSSSQPTSERSIPRRSSRSRHARNAPCNSRLPPAISAVGTHALSSSCCVACSPNSAESAPE